MMKHLKITLFVCALIISSTARAEKYYVNTDVLNLRSCEGTNCNIIGKLASGEVVELLEDRGKWVKVKTYYKGEGFVIKKSLVEKNTSRPAIDKDSLYTIGNFILEALVYIGSSFVNIFIFIIFALIAIFIYFLPSKLASSNKNSDKIYKVNLFLGWIPAIWLVLLFAALVGESREE